MLKPFSLSFKKLIRHRRKNRKMLVVVDNARWHHANLSRLWLEENNRFIKLDFLPAYSTVLNHIERVWKLARHLCTHNRYFPSVEILAETVSKQFMFWSKKITKHLLSYAQ
jgi:transposase